MWQIVLLDVNQKKRLNSYEMIAEMYVIAG